MNTPGPSFDAIPGGIENVSSSSPSSRAHWYAVHTRSRHEKRVAEQLQLMSIECFLPLYNTWNRWKDRNALVQLPLFPSYIFVRIAPEDRLRVLQPPGVVRLLGNESRPEPLPEAEVVALQTALSQDLPIEPHPYLKVGELVLITRGPFEGLEGLLLRKNRLRVVLSLSQIYSSFVLDVDATTVRPIHLQASAGPLWQPLNHSSSIAPKSFPETSARTI